MKIGKEFDLWKATGKLRSLIPTLLNEEKPISKFEDVKRTSDYKSIHAETLSLEKKIEKIEEKKKEEINQRNKKEEFFFTWMKTFLYLTDDYTIENLESAYSSEKYRENRNPFVKTETKKKDEDCLNTLFDIYSDLDKNGLDDTGLKKKPSFRVSEIFLIDRLNRGSAVFQHTEINEKVGNKDYEVLLKCSPLDTFSLEYQLRFFKTLLCFVMNQYLAMDGFRYLDWNKDIYDELGNKCHAFQIHFEICLRLIGAYIHDLPGFDNSESLILQELRKYRSDHEYSVIELEQIRVFGQILSLQVFLNYVNETGELTELKENGGGGEKIRIEEVRAEEFEKEALALMNYNLFLTYIPDTEAPVREVVELGKRSLQIRDPRRQWRAFNNLGVYAVDNVQRQLAYDVYYTWLYDHAVGEMEDCFSEGNAPGKKLFPYKINEKKKAENRALMLGNFAYVCADISDTYDLQTKEYQKFHMMAEEQIQSAIQENGTAGNLYTTYGTLLSERAGMETDLRRKYSLYLQAVEQYQLCYSSDDGGGEFETLEGMFNILQEAFAGCIVENVDLLTQMESPGAVFNAASILNQFHSNNFYVLMKEILTNTYRDKFNDGLENEEQKGEYTPLYMTWRMERNRKRWKDSGLLTDGDKGDLWVNDIECILLLLNEMSATLKQNLRRRDYSTVHYYTREKGEDRVLHSVRKNVSPIAFYTTLNTASYLFDELQRESYISAPLPNNGGGGRNCLTAMNSRYMNDPYEGLTLLNVLMKNSDSNKDGLFQNRTAAKVRDDIYKDHYIFLKSFTNLNDSLIMWNRYSSDYNSEGRSCNGCLISLDTDEFGGAVYHNEKRKSLDRLEKNEAEDEYYLYRVVYLSKNGEISRMSNPDIAPDTGMYARIVRDYNFLKFLVRILDVSLKKIPIELENKESETLRQEIRSFVQCSLRLIIFLFKGEEYADEKESRIVFSRRPDQQNTIRVLDGKPGKLCINPYFQIYVKSIMLGPNVREEENWIPYLQYQLNRMWAKNPAVGKEPGKRPQDMYKIEKSEIPYRA